MSEPTPAEIYPRAALETLAQVRSRVSRYHFACSIHDPIGKGARSAYDRILRDLDDLERAAGK